MGFGAMASANKSIGRNFKYPSTTYLSTSKVCSSIAQGKVGFMRVWQFRKPYSWKFEFRTVYYDVEIEIGKSGSGQ